jgi:hypothetical protein
VERRVEHILERGHGELHDAGVDLADEGADADRADHEPGIEREGFKEARGSGFREVQVASPNGRSLEFEKIEVFDFHGRRTQLQANSSEWMPSNSSSKIRLKSPAMAKRRLARFSRESVPRSQSHH